MNISDYDKKILRQFFELCVDAYVLHNQFKKLFERSDERLRLLEETANGFFHILFECMQHQTLLAICKLTDSEKSFGKFNNLTIDYILKNIQWPEYVIANLEPLVDEMKKFRTKLSPARNKIISHLDLKTHLKSESLGKFEVGEDVKFFDNLQEFVTIIYDHCFGEPFPINAFVESDADDLIEALKDAVDYKDYFDNRQVELFTRVQKRRFKDA